MISEGRKAPDMGMPNQAGNNLLYALVLKAKSERELMGMIDKLAQKMGGIKMSKTLLSLIQLQSFFNKRVTKENKVKLIEMSLFK